MEVNEQSTLEAVRPLIDFSWEELHEIFLHEDEKFFLQDSH